jgi:spermidine synthase
VRASRSRSPLEILACEPTRLGLLCLRRRELLGRPGASVTEITLNHEFLMSSYITTSERALARHAISMHPRNELSVLVGGLGLGYTAHEVLSAGRNRVAKAEVVEYLPQVIQWVVHDLVPLASELKSDGRLTMIEGDLYERLARPPAQQYDIILVDVDHSPDEQLGTSHSGFYTTDGLRRARRHLADGGVLGVWSYAESSPFVTSLHEVFGEVRVEPVVVWNDLVDEEQTDWLFFARG